MSDQVDIEIGRAKDVADLVAFNRAMAAETEDKLLDLDTVTAGVSALLKDSSRGFYVVARLDGLLVGSLMITTEWSDWRCGDFWWIQSVYVRPDSRRQGIYRKLYDFVRTRAAETEHVCGFRLYVEQDNRRAQQTYEALGMQQSVYRMFEASPD